jgi:light-regulated signal transduction histidine kinase (bacteriophytochrome)
LAQDILTDIGRTQFERHVTVVIEPLLKARADASLMRIALENMLSNAWKFTSNTPDARIEFGCMQQGGKPRYFVCDNGAGSDMAHVDRVFTPFQRLHSDSEFEGTGIGFTIVQRVIDRHGGRVWVDSQVNQGTTVYFELGSAGSS